MISSTTRFLQRRLPPVATRSSCSLHMRNNQVANFSAGTSATQAQPIVELREYNIHPEHAVSYLKATTEASTLRKSLLPLRFFCMPDTGGKLNVATHAYYFAAGHTERDSLRARLGKNPEWKEYLSVCRPYMQSQQSNIFVEAPLVKSVDVICGLDTVPESQQVGSDCIMELRRYKLKLGYDTVPRFLSLYGNGLPSKLEAEGTDPTTSLVTLLYSDVGRLNEVIEVWRHGDGTAAMEKSRAAARGAGEWREAIANIADLALEFTSTIHRPTSFSP